MIFRRKFYFFESFRDFVDDIFNPSIARVKTVINKVEKTREKVKFRLKIIITKLLTTCSAI